MLWIALQSPPGTNRYCPRNISLKLGSNSVAYATELLPSLKDICTVCLTI